MTGVSHASLDFILDYLYYMCHPSSVFNPAQGTVLEPALLEEIKKINDCNELYSFIPLMFVNNEVISKLANEKVNELLNALPLHCINKTDEIIRKSKFSKHYDKIFKYWYDLKPSIVDAQNCHSITCLASLKILCCHPNGYIRYKAIDKLAQKSMQNAIPFLLIRVNDWVEEIRIKCLAILNSITNDEIIFHFIESLSLLDQLKAKGRYDQIQLTNKIELILTNKCSDELFSKLNSQEKTSARYAFTILANSDSNSMIEQLLSTTLNHHDIIIKLSALDLANKRYDPKRLLIYLNKIKDDKSMLLRKKVLYAFIEHYPNQSKIILEHALFDHGRSIRSFSRYYLKQQGISEFSNYYKSAITRQDKRIKLAILGLSETGNTHDFCFIQPFLEMNITHLSPIIIIATFKMQPKNWKNIISQLLSNPDAAMLNAFATCIQENPGCYSFEEIFDLVYKKHSTMHARYFIKAISNGYHDKWVVLNFILNELEMMKEDDIKVIFERYLLKWLHGNSPNKVFVRPAEIQSKQCLDKVNNLLKKEQNYSLYKELLENIELFSKPTN